MPESDAQSIAYRRSRFKTRLPAGRLYAASHFWLEAQPESPGLWRVGFTKFAARMLGDLVEHDFEVKPGDPVAVGQIIGWIEGFKATSDLYCCLDGNFHRGNPDLREDLDLLRTSPYQKGWLFEAHGTPGDDAVDVQGYAEILDMAIDKVLEQEK